MFTNCFPVGQLATVNPQKPPRRQKRRVSYLQPVPVTIDRPRVRFCILFLYLFFSTPVSRYNRAPTVKQASKYFLTLFYSSWPCHHHVPTSSLTVIRLSSVRWTFYCFPMSSILIVCGNVCSVHVRAPRSPLPAANLCGLH